MEMNKVNSECPVCGREFKVSEIESHVDKCLFLNSENKDNSKFLKRNSEERKYTCNGTSPKKLKVSPDTESKSSTSYAADVSLLTNRLLCKLLFPNVMQFSWNSKSQAVCVVYFYTKLDHHCA